MKIRVTAEKHLGTLPWPPTLPSAASVSVSLANREAANRRWSACWPVCTNRTTARYSSTARASSAAPTDQHPPERRRIAIVFQQPNLFPHLSVKSNLLYGFKRCAPEQKRSTCHPGAVLKLENLLPRGSTIFSAAKSKG